MDELRALYQEMILDHSRHPRNFGKPAWAGRSARGYNPLCGDQITLHLHVGPDGKIAEAAFEGRGCAICLASASMLTEAVAGKDAAKAQDYAEEVRRLCTEEDYVPPAEDEEALEPLQALAGVRQYPVRVKCATLAWHTLLAALEGRKEATTE